MIDITKVPVRGQDIINIVPLYPAAISTAEIIAQTQLAKATVSYHLNKLIEAGKIKLFKYNQSNYYYRG